MQRVVAGCSSIIQSFRTLSRFCLLYFQELVALARVTARSSVLYHAHLFYMKSSRSSQLSRRRRENAPVPSRASAMQSSSSSPPSVTAAAATAAMAAVRDSDLFDRAPLAVDEAPPPVEAAAPAIDSDCSDYTSDEEAANLPPTSAQRQHAIPSRQQRISNAAEAASIAHGASADASQNQSAAAAQCCAAGIQALARGSLHEAVRCFTAATHHDVHCRAAFANRCILNALAGFYSAALPDAVWLLRGSLVRENDGDALSNPQILFKQVQTRAREVVLPCVFNPYAALYFGMIYVV